VKQAEALASILHAKHMDLDAVIELVVDDRALLARIEKRAQDSIAKGEAVRADDNPEAFRKRLESYHAQTAPVSAFYAAKCALKAVDGMAPIDDVSAAIERALHKRKKAAASTRAGGA
jgi:adenylate kinase